MKRSFLYYGKKLFLQRIKSNYKESKVTTKKLVGVYDVDTHTLEIDGEDKDILKELEDFNGAILEVTMKVKEETDLADE